jgi:hypothetical protein
VIERLFTHALRDWLKDAEQTLAKLHSQFLAEADDAEKRLAELAQFDPRMTYEIEGRRKDAIRAMMAAYERYAQYADRLSRGLDRPSRMPAIALESETFRALVCKWRPQMRDLKERVIRVCISCGKAGYQTDSGAANVCTGLEAGKCRLMIEQAEPLKAR